MTTDNAGIRERANEVRQTAAQTFLDFDHVDELTERVAALEAALRPFADIWNVYGKSGRIDYETAIMSFVRFPYDGSQVDAAFKQAADALAANADAGNGGA